MSGQAWGFTQKLNQPVANNGTVLIPTHDFDPSLAAGSQIGLAVFNNVLELPDDATVTFSGAGATVTNLTGRTWSGGWDAYVYVSRSDAGGGGGGGMGTTLGATITIPTSETVIPAGWYYNPWTYGIRIVWSEDPGGTQLSTGPVIFCSDGINVFTASNNIVLVPIT